MVHCLWYINRKAREYIEQEMKDRRLHGPCVSRPRSARPAPAEEMKDSGEEPRNAPSGIYGGDVPDELCYQWAEEYFRDPNAGEDHREAGVL